MIRRITLGALLGTLVALSATAQDNWPNRPIRFVVPFAAGGPSDIVARIIAPKMSAALGQPVVVDNRVGAGGVTGVDVVAKAPPDGYVFGIGSAGALAISPNLDRGTPYNPLRDLAPITLGVLVAEPLVVPAATGFRTVHDLLAAARARPGSLNFGSTGSGSMPHLAAEQLRAAAGGLDIVHISYRSGGALATAILTNEVQMGFADLPVLLSHIREGSMRALAVGTRERLSWIPDVPTMTEVGLPSVDASNWHGLIAAAQVPEPILVRLHAAAAGAFRDAEVRRLLDAQGAIPGGDSRAEFAAFLRRENEKWAEVIRANNIRAD
jgi:tripartite-type tricarboxylate transporter receptor subunit TctC